MENASDTAQEILTRMESAHSAAAGLAPRAVQEGVEWPEKLKEAGFPARQCARLAGGLFGESERMADVLWPKIATGDCILILYGNRGAGKTLMACEWSKRRVESGKAAGRYAKCADIIAEIKSTWHDGGKSIGTEQDVLRKYRSTKYLVIDEFHEKGASEWEARTLINILDHRYDSMLVTVLIANLSEAEASKVINPSVIDRANETGGMVVCNWKSYRA